MEIKLLEYFRKVAELEKDKYTYECLAANITSEIAGLERESKDPRVDVNAIKKQYPILDVECKEPTVLPKPDDSSLAIIAGTIFFDIIGVVVAGQIVSFLDFFFDKQILDIIAVIALIILNVLGLGTFISEKNENRQKYKEYQESVKNHEKYTDISQKKKKAQAEFSNDIAKAKAQRQIEIKNIITSLRQEREEVKKSFETVCEALKDIYNENIIYPKYRELIPVTMMCEYLESHRCDTLEGHEGAYNIYESEIRANVIISQLDQVVSSLDSIKSNQYKLHEAILEARHESNRIAHSMMREIASSNQQQIAIAQQNQALLEYNNQVAERIHNIQETEFWVR